MTFFILGGVAFFNDTQQGQPWEGGCLRESTTENPVKCKKGESATSDDKAIKLAIE